jgi:YD repeat-containing protein
MGSNIFSAVGCADWTGAERADGHAFTTRAKNLAMRVAACAALLSFATFVSAERGFFPIGGGGRIGKNLYSTEKDACETGIFDIGTLPDGWCVRSYPGEGCYVGAPWNNCTGIGRMYIGDIDCGAGTPVSSRFDGRGSGGYGCGGSVVNTGAMVGRPRACVKNPCDAATGNKYQAETDYVSADGQLRLIRYYNSFTMGGFRRFGPNWTDYYARSLNILVDSVRAERPSGRQIRFLRDGLNYSLYDVGGEKLEAIRDVTGTVLGWRLRDDEADAFEEYDAGGRLIFLRNRAGLTQQLVYSDASTPPEIAPAPGLLIQVIDAFGRSLSFTYDSLSRVASATDPAGQVYGYTYNTFGNVASISAPDGSVRSYLYEKPDIQTHLTGISDENGVRFATWTYDDSGRVVATEHAGGAERATLTFNGDATTTVREFVSDTSHADRVYHFQITKSLALSNALTGDPGPAQIPASTSFDSNGYMASSVDWNGNRTDYVHDAAGLEIQRTEGLTTGGGTTPQTRTFTTEWHPTFRLRTRAAEPLRITTYVYNGDEGVQCGSKRDGALVAGVLCSKTVHPTADASGSQGLSAMPTGPPRSWSYSYNANGRLLTVDGPRADVADVTTYTYYADDDPDAGKRGNIATITNAAGHVTQITAYNAHGKPTTIVDPNGLTTTLAYDSRRRLTSRTVGGETTSYEYDGVGQLTRVTLPDASFLAYSYDSAHRLTGMQDNLGNRIAYTLDVMGNRTQERVLDPASNLAQTRSRVYSNLNRLVQEIGALGQTTEYAYDDQGNVIAVKDPLNHTTTNAYDALNRLVQVTDPNSGVTGYGYDGRDALASVTDPRGLVTGYAVDGLGNLTRQTSPDTGVTTNSYDAAGNLLTRTDAKGQATTYTYDALNRVTSISYHDNSKQAYRYDQGTNGIGRLSAITETSPTQQVTSEITYGYDLRGRVTSETRTIGGHSYVTAYTYDSAGRLSTMTYPSGRTTAYAFDPLGRIDQITTTGNGQSAVVVQGVYYHPFGGVKGFTFGNGQVYSRTVDQDGRIASYTLGTARYDISFDAASRITGIAEMGNPSNVNAYGYDDLDRLTSAVVPASTYAYSYDAVGNRLTKLAGGTAYTYAYSATSNRIDSVTSSLGSVRNFLFDANGSTTADGVNSYAYDARGRMVHATSSVGATSYQVNALGQRVRKTNTVEDTVFHYDTRGHLIAETDAGGTTKREYIYLGDIPVGVIQ